MRFQNFLRAAYVCTVIVVILCDEKDDVGRSKRFFQNINSYFSSKTTTDPATLVSSTEKQSRIVKILVSTVKSAVSPCMTDDCTSSRTYNPVYVGSTPITYLTPPPTADAASQYDISKYFETHQSPIVYRDDTAKRNHGYKYFNAYNNNDLWTVGKDEKTIYDTFSQSIGESGSLKVKLKGKY